MNSTAGLRRSFWLKDSHSTYSMDSMAVTPYSKLAQYPVPGNATLFFYYFYNKKVYLHFRVRLYSLVKSYGY